MTSRAWADLVLVLLLAAGALAGWRRGGFRLAGSVAGAAAGLLVGLAVVPPIAARLAGVAGSVATVAGVLLIVVVGAAVGRWVGSLPASLLARLRLGGLDRLAGGVGGLALAFVLIGVALALLPSVARAAEPAGHWLAAARSSAVGSAATQTAQRALDAVPPAIPVPAPGP